MENFYGEEREDTVAWNKETYRRLKQAEKGEVKSYVQEIALAIMDCKETATSRETFMEQMQAKGVWGGLAGQAQVHHIC